MCGLLAQQETTQIKVNTHQIPEHIRIELLSVIYDATAAYFQQPGVEERYERWKAEKEKKAVAVEV